ncbi:MAG: hypothetical protein KKA19_04685, partial [Candidatus Margulisbacteria bacterium]|nr:hypothetical protein [Candidatus Margulisiibacteriota bacterium]
MSKPKTHLIHSLWASFLLYPALNENTILFCLSSVLVDIDHAFDYIKNTKSLNVKGLYIYHDIITENADKNYLSLSIFHTIECYLLLLYLATIFPFFYYILAGFVFHHLTDLIRDIKRGYPFVRAVSIIEYFIRRKKRRYLTTMKELLNKDNLNVPPHIDLKEWQKKWK